MAAGTSSASPSPSSHSFLPSHGPMHGAERDAGCQRERFARRQTAKQLFCADSSVLKYPEQLCLSERSCLARCSALTWAVSTNIAPSARTRAAEGVAHLVELMQTSPGLGCEPWTWHLKNNPDSLLHLEAFISGAEGFPSAPVTPAVLAPQVSPPQPKETSAGVCWAGVGEPQGCLRIFLPLILLEKSTEGLVNALV